MLATASLAGVFAVGSLLPVTAAVDGGDQIRWQVQPASTSTDLVITSVVGTYKADGSLGGAIKAALYNGSGERLRKADIKVTLQVLGKCSDGTAADDWLTGRAGWTNADGVASFHPKIGCEALGLRLRALASDTGSETSGNQATDVSATFDIRKGQLTGCTQSGCSDSDAQGDTSVQVTAYSDGYLLLDVGGGSLTCGDGYTTTSKVATFDVTGNGSDRTIVQITLDASLVTRSHKHYDVCLKKPDLAATLLDDCPRKITNGTPNCVVSRKREKDGDVQVTISVQPGDPRVGI